MCSNAFPRIVSFRFRALDLRRGLNCQAPWLLAAFLPRLLPGGGRDESPALIASLLLATLALALAGGGITYSVTGGGSGALAVAERADAAQNSRYRRRRGSIRLRILLGGADVDAADAWGLPALAAARGAEQCEAEAALLRAGTSETDSDPFAAPQPRLGGRGDGRGWAGRW